MHEYLLHHLLESSSRLYPERPAVIYNNDMLSYAGLHRETEQLAQILTGLGVRQGARVGLMVGKSIQAIVALIAILKTGAAYVPIDPAAPPSRANFIISNCNAELLLTTSDLAGKLMPGLDTGASLKRVAIIDGNVDLSDAPFEVVDLSRHPRQGAATRLPPISINDGNPAYILHTSGSTGVPKGVVISHANSLAFVNMAAEFFMIKPEDRLACHAPLHFDLSVFDIFVALKSGAAIILIPEHLSIFPTRLAEYIVDTKITVWNSIASILSLLADRGQLHRLALKDLRLVVFSGDILPVKHLRTLKAAMPDARFFNVYGQTEANSSTCFEVTEIPDDDGWKIPIGKPFPNFEVFAVDEGNRLACKAGDIGELYVSAPTIALGYLGDRSRTAELFGIDPRTADIDRRVYKTGDIVRIDDNLDFVFLGRKDQQVKSRGYRIHLGEIELCMKKHPAIEEAIVVAVPDELFGSRLLAYISLVAGGMQDDIAILDFCGRYLPRYMLPDKLLYIQDFPKTTTGKIDRKGLADMSLPRDDAGSVDASTGCQPGPA